MTTISLDDYVTFDHKQDGLTRRVFRRGSGPAIILIHELPNLTLAVVSLAESFIEAGFTVYLPSLVGEPGLRPNFFQSLGNTYSVCVSQEFRQGISHDGDAPIVHWLQSLARKVDPAGPVGMMGLCFSGGFALAAASDPVVAGAVACEPSLPLFSPHDLGVALETIDAIKVRQVPVRVYRFEGDTVSPCERMVGLAKAFGEVAKGGCLPDSAANPAYTHKPHHHSVVTNHLIEAPGEPTLFVRNEIIAFFKWRLSGGPQPTGTHQSLRDCFSLGCKFGKH